MNIALERALPEEKQTALDAIKTLLGPGGFLSAENDMAPYLEEARGLFKGQAYLIARPSTTEEVSAVVKLCAQGHLPIIALGGRTGLTGAGVSVPGSQGIVLSLERMNRILDIDERGYTMTVEAGCILENVQNAAAERNLLFPLDLGARGSCTLGGNIATNAGGIQVLRYGSMRELVLGLEVVLASGEIWSGLRRLRKDNTGYDLKQLFIGSEGTLGIVTRAVIKLFPRPASVSTALVAIPDVQSAIDLFALARKTTGDRLNAFELIQRYGVDISCQHGGATDPFPVRYPWYLLMEVSAPAADEGNTAPSPLEPLLEQGMEAGWVLDAVIAGNISQARALWRVREALSDHQHFEGASIKHDISVPIDRIPEFVSRASAAVVAAIPGSRPLAFGHIGDGNVHFNLSQPKGMDAAEYLAKTYEVYRLVHDLTASFDGSISAEHGIGQLKSADLAHYKSATELALMRTVKAALDPASLLNPGKILASTRED